MLCPCHISFRQKGSYDTCEAMWGVHIERGEYETTSLGGLNVPVAAFAPGPTMYGGDWTALLYIDDKTTPEQEEALIAIFSGEVGGPWARIALFFTEGKFKAAKHAPFQFSKESQARTLRVSDIASLEVAAIRGVNPEEEVKLTNLRNVIHGSEHVLARSNHHVLDEGLRWDNSGKHGLYSTFRWSGS